MIEKIFELIKTKMNLAEFINTGYNFKPEEIPDSIVDKSYIVKVENVGPSEDDLADSNFSSDIITVISKINVIIVYKIPENQSVDFESTINLKNEQIIKEIIKKDRENTDIKNISFLGYTNETKQSFLISTLNFAFEYSIINM